MSGSTTRTMEHAVLAELLAEIRSLQASSTEQFGRLQSNVVNQVLSSGLRQIPTEGLVTESFRTPFGSIAIANYGTSTVTLTSSPPAGSAPQQGKGTARIPANGFAVVNLASTTYTVYGTAGDFVSIQVFTKPQPPVAAFGAVTGTVAISGTVPVSGTITGTLTDGDGTANFAGTGLPTVSHNYVWNVAAGWDRWASFGAGGDGRGVASASQPSSTPVNDVGAGGAAVTRTYTAVAGQRYRLTHLSASYSVAVSTGTGLLTVTDGATVVAGWDIPLALNTPFVPALPPGGIQGSVNTNLVITLAAGAITTVGRLNTAVLIA